MRFKDKNDFIKAFIHRADKGNIIIGLSTSCKKDADGVPLYSTGTYITGDIYIANKFYDSFIIDNCYADRNSAEKVIKRIREVTNIFSK